MAEATRMSSKKKKKSARKRQERRFIPQSAYSPWIPRISGGVGAMALGAGAWAHLYGHVFEADEKLKPVPQYLIAAGAVLTGVAIWFSAGGGSPLRVGDPGIAMEQGEVRRMPWWAVEQIAWESGNLALTVTGKDESGTNWSFKVPLKAHAEAIGWIVSEAEARIPKRIDIPDAVREKLPAASDFAGTKVDLEPLQVVGRRCAITNKAISYEPDARVCERCERVYFKDAVPKKCKCGASLAHLRGAAAEASDDEAETQDDEAEAETEKASS